MLNAHVLSNAMCFLAMCARHCLSLQLAVQDDHVASEQHSSSNPSHAGRQSRLGSDSSRCRVGRHGDLQMVGRQSVLVVGGNSGEVG